MRSFVGHRRAVRAVAYAPSGLLASAGDDHSVRLWDLTGSAEPTTLDGAFDGLLELTFSSCGRFLAAGGRAGSLTVWDLHERDKRPLSARAGGPVVALAFTGDARAILIALRTQRYGGDPGRLLCWNLQPRRPFQVLPWDGDIESAAIAPVRDLVAIAGQHRGVELWEVARPRAEPLWWLPARVRAVCFAPGPARRLAVASGRTIHLYDVDERKPFAVCNGHRSDVQTLAFSPDGLLLLSGSADRSVRTWDALSGRQLAANDWQIGAIHAVAFSPDGMTAAGGGEKTPVVVWDVDVG